MTPTQVREKVKVKYDISVTDLDATIDECVEVAIDLLAPYVNNPLTVDSTVSLAQTDTEFTLPVAGSTLKRLHLLSTSSDHEVAWSDWTQHGDKILLTDTLPWACTAKVYAEGDYTMSDSIPARYTPALIDYACSEFATTLAGSKSKYNVYAQSSGARGVDNMLDLAAFYEQRAERRITLVSDGEGMN